MKMNKRDKKILLWIVGISTFLIIFSSIQGYQMKEIRSLKNVISSQQEKIERQEYFTSQIIGEINKNNNQGFELEKDMQLWLQIDPSNRNVLLNYLTYSNNNTCVRNPTSWIFYNGALHFGYPNEKATYITNNSATFFEQGSIVDFEEWCGIKTTKVSLI